MMKWEELQGMSLKVKKNLVTDRGNMSLPACTCNNFHMQNIWESKYMYFHRNSPAPNCFTILCVQETLFCVVSWSSQLTIQNFKTALLHTKSYLVLVKFYMYTVMFCLHLGSEQTSSQASGGQRLVTADGTYATQSALSTPGITSLVKKDDEKR